MQRLKKTGSASLAGSPMRRQDKRNKVFLSCRRIGDPASEADPVFFRF
jgi:hypothetical protein